MPLAWEPAGSNPRSRKPTNEAPQNPMKDHATRLFASFFIVGRKTRFPALSVVERLFKEKAGLTNSPPTTKQSL